MNIAETTKNTGFIVVYLNFFLLFSKINKYYTNTIITIIPEIIKKLIKNLKNPGFDMN